MHPRSSNMKKYLRSSVGRYLILGLLALAIGVNVFILNASHLTGNAVPMPFGVGASVVLSGSMEPALSVGDLLVFCEHKHYEEGDVVVYQSGRTPVVHRIVELDGETVITRGDANNAPDEPFGTAMIKGKVIASIPVVGYLIWALKTPVGTILTLAAAVLLMEMSYRKERQAKKNEQDKIKAEIRQLMKELDEQKH